MRDLTGEEILAQCPEVINKRDIPTHNAGGRPRTGGGSRKVPFWNEKDRIRAASVYAITGVVTKTSEITGIPSETLRRWRAEDWWGQVMDRVKQEKDDEHEQKFTEIIDKTIVEINERLENGDFVYDAKKGKLVRKPMGGKEIGVLTSIMVDKRDLLRRKQKSQIEQQSTKELLQQIASQVRDFITKPKEVVIEGEVIRERIQNEV